VQRYEEEVKKSMSSSKKNKDEELIPEEELEMSLDISDKLLDEEPSEKNFSPFIFESKSQLEEEEEEELEEEPVDEVIPEKTSPIALKTATVRLEGAKVALVKGQPIEGLTAQEARHLKFHGFIR